MELYDGYEFMIDSPYYDEIEELKIFFKKQNCTYQLFTAKKLY